jgi:uncharacterized membrane protein
MSLAPLSTAPAVIQLHAAAAIAALLLGAAILFRRKGTPAHRLLGRLWVGLMLVVATTGLFIQEIRMIGPFSPVHLFSLMTYAGVALALWRIRHGDVRGHAAAMQSLYVGALLLAGAFTLLPGRRMHDVLFGAQAGWTPSLLAVGLALGATVLLWLRLRQQLPRPA